MPRASSRIDPYLHSLSNRNGLNVEQLRHARYKCRINSSWVTNWGFSYWNDSYYEEETILTNTNPFDDPATYVNYENYAQGHLTEGGTIIFRKTTLREGSVQKTICVCRVANAVHEHPSQMARPDVVNTNEEPATLANPEWCLPMIQMYEENEDNPNDFDEESYADFITRFGTYMIYVASVIRIMGGE